MAALRPKAPKTCKPIKPKGSPHKPWWYGAKLTREQEQKLFEEAVRNTAALTPPRERKRSRR
jgi:hypothetical protein